jgi:hypothetical protein
MITQIDLAAFQEMERNSLTHDEWVDVMRKEGWPRGGKMEQIKRYKLYLAASEGQRRFASDVPFHDPRRELYWADSGKYGIESRFWKVATGQYAKAHELYFFKHRPQKQKDGPAFFPGKLAGDRCISANVEHIDFIIADVDAADSNEIADCIMKIKQAGLGCDLYSTYNHDVPHTEVKHDEYEAFCKEHELEPASREAAQRYLVDKKKYPAVIAKDAFVEDQCVAIAGREGHGCHPWASADDQAPVGVYARPALRPRRDGEARLRGQRCTRAVVGGGAKNVIRGSRHSL